MMEQCKKMCKSMSVEQKSECVLKMMPNCLDSVLNALDDKECQTFGKEIQSKLNKILERYIEK